MPLMSFSYCLPPLMPLPLSIALRAYATDYCCAVIFAIAASRCHAP